MREIPGSQIQLKEQSTIGGIVTIGMAVILLISIALLFLRRKEGLYLGIIPAILVMFQWILVHIIFGYPDINGIWWYPIFPVIQGLLIIYFSYLAWKNEKNFK